MGSVASWFVLTAASLPRTGLIGRDRRHHTKSRNGYTDAKGKPVKGLSREMYVRVDHGRHEAMDVMAAIR
jgi:hypothetical protein